VLILGLTGGIGAGKSTASAELARLGAVIIDADHIAREVVEPGSPGLDMLAAEFGEDIVGADGALDRASLAERAFVSAECTAALNAITHPLIGERTAELFAQAADDAIVVHDMPLLVEGGMAPGYHLVLVVDTPEDVRLHRLVELRGLPEDDARSRIERQASDEQRRAVADVLLDNAGAEDALREQVREAWDLRITQMAANLAHGRAVLPENEVIGPLPEWRDEARRAAGRLRHALGGLEAEVEHVGPTAEGIPAVDVVALEVRPAPEVDPASVVTRLTQAGYVPDPDESFVLRWVDPARPLEIRVARGAGEPLAASAAAADADDTEV